MVDKPEELGWEYDLNFHVLPGLEGQGGLGGILVEVPSNNKLAQFTIEGQECRVLQSITSQATLIDIYQTLCWRAKWTYFSLVEAGIPESTARLCLPPAFEEWEKNHGR